MFTQAQLSLYERCPQRFFYTHVLEVGGRRTTNAFMDMREVVRRVTVANVLSRCPFCDRAMVLMRTENQNQRYLACMAWREGRVCSNEWVRFPEVEDVFISDVRFLIQRCPQPQLHVDACRIMLKTISKRRSHLRARLTHEHAASVMLSKVAASAAPGRSRRGTRWRRWKPSAAACAWTAANGRT